MQGSHSKYLSSLLSLIIHGFLFAVLYTAAHHYNPDTNGLIELGFSDNGGGGGGAFIPEPEEKISTGEKSAEVKVKEQRKTADEKKERTDNGNKTGTGQPGQGGSGNGSGNGTGTGKTGLSLGFPLISKPKEEIYLVAVDEMPEPIGGIEAISARIILPPQVKQSRISGTVFVLAFVDEYGTVRKTLLTKGIGHGCDEAVLNAVFRSRFKPGKQDGRNVKVQVQIPVGVSSRQ